MHVAPLRAPLALILAAFSLLVATVEPARAAPTPASTPDLEYYQIVAYDPATGRLTYIGLAAAGPRKTVDLSDMTLDVKCANRWVYDPSDSLRISLLEKGCARLLPGKGTAEEKAAESHAPGAGSNSSTSASQPGRSTEFLNGVLPWLSANWLNLLGLFLGIASLGWTVWFIYNRRVRVVLIGAPSAGKTGLWKALKDGTAEPRLRPSIGASRPVPLEPIPFGKYTLYPSITDTAGGEPWLALDELERSRSFRWKRKLVLIVVASPISVERPAGTTIRFDREFIDLQKGYINLPRAIIGAKKRRRRPDLVVFFISKFDLLAKVSPDDSAAANERGEVKRMFADHEKLLRTVCNNKSVPFTTVIGSAARGWGIDEVKKKLQGVIKQ